MGGLMSREKGKRAEREIVKSLQPIVTELYEAVGREAPVIERNLMQSHKGGYDIEGLDWLAPEVKHHEQLAVDTWWEQATRQATSKGPNSFGEARIPVLFFRKNNAKWRVRMYASLGVGENLRMTGIPADISMDHFLQWFRHTLKHRLDRGL